MDKQSFEYLRGMSDIIYVGIKTPLENKVNHITLKRDLLFDSRGFLVSNVTVVRHAIGIFDDKKQEHILLFENVKSMKDCIKYFYGSSHVIPRRWYEILV